MASRKKLYAVVRGRKPGLYTTWAGPGNAAEQVQGVPGAVFKGFHSRAEAATWLAQFDDETLAAAPDLVALAREAQDHPRDIVESLLAQGKIVIHTDGGAIDNPGPGGYGAVLRYGQGCRELCGGYRHTTNNRMELMACIQALGALTRPLPVVLFSDSRYVVDAMTKSWARRWRSNGWMRSKSEGVENADLWDQLLDLCDRYEVEFRWVRGHAGNPDNERCDRLAVQAARQPDLPPDEGYEAQT